MHQLSCNTIPDCHSNSGNLILHTPSSHNSLQNNTNYCVVPAKCVNNNGNVVSTDLMYYPCDMYSNDCDISQNKCNTNQTYITKTIKAYKVIPAKNSNVGFLVEKNLQFKTGQIISCSIVDNDSSFFNGTVFDYDKDTGFLNIGDIDNITGNFSNSVFYNINLNLFDPEIMKLKQRMDYLYKYLFQVDLDTLPNFNPVSEQIQFFDTKLYNLMMYLFNENIRNRADYELTESYITKTANYIYKYLFDVNIDRNLDFNPNGFAEISLDNMRSKIYQIYIYLFAVNLEQTPWFNPNTTNN